MLFEHVNAEPGEQQKLCDAFDAAWIAINAARPIDVAQRAAERERLAWIIAQLWQAGAKGNLAAKAIPEFMRDGKSRSPTTAGKSVPEI